VIGHRSRSSLTINLRRHLIALPDGSLLNLDPVNDQT
jgi:hypothetical protein